MHQDLWVFIIIPSILLLQQIPCTNWLRTHHRPIYKLLIIGACVNTTFHHSLCGNSIEWVLGQGLLQIWQVQFQRVVNLPFNLFLLLKLVILNHLLLRMVLIFLFMILILLLLILRKDIILLRIIRRKILWNIACIIIVILKLFACYHRLRLWLIIIGRLILGLFCGKRGTHWNIWLFVFGIILEFGLRF